MTAQFHEKLIYKGESVSLCSEPLNQYFELTGKRPRFIPTSTALWRGYIGTWEIVGARLYLIGLTGEINSDTNSDPSDDHYYGIMGKMEGAVEATLATLFPNFPERVFAHWYCGQLRVPRGELLNYVHGGYASSYDWDLLIRIERGVVIDEKLVDNRGAVGSLDTSLATASVNKRLED